MAEVPYRPRSNAGSRRSTSRVRVDLDALMDRQLLGDLAREPPPPAEAQKLQLRDDASRAIKEVADLKAFLNDYGLTWVGHADASTDQPVLLSPSPQAENRQESHSHARTSAVTLDMDGLGLRLAELNAIADEACKAVVQARPGGPTQLHGPEAVVLRLYRDGLQLHKTPFSRYSEVGAQAILEDIMLGYFPYVLKREFPEGVTIQLQDLRSKDHDRAFQPFSGHAFALDQAAGLQERPGSASGRLQRELSPGQQRMADLAQTGRPLSKDEYLQQLPKRVIRNGKVIDLRSSIAQLLAGSAEAAASHQNEPTSRVSHTPGGSIPNHPASPPPAASVSHPATATLRIRREDGKQTYVVRMGVTETIGTLRKHLDAFRSEQGVTGKYEIRSGFPLVAHADVAETLQDAGLTPSATLLLTRMAS
ncbi:hypothetical protein WJX72_004654 [[Myrmecia] bisecta]|uniref:UBX domain-containing protein 11 n=1 Tax=[Myrmecia] bisecta TaxID=41462 RepID=A0AAW1PW42_9CHLO